MLASMLRNKGGNIKMKQYTVTEIAKESGVSKATVSRWLANNHVSPDETKGKKKLFNETILNKFKKKHEKTNKVERPTLVEVLQDEVNSLKKQNETLRNQLEIKDKQIEALTTITKQSQTLNFADKKKELEEPKKEDKKKNFWHFWS